MANRQYVGARYVPKFADPVEWNSALSYEALTIVTHLGNSFTSKKPVPAGVDIGNTEYWVNTGNYNEQVEELRQEVKNSNTKNIVLIGDSYGTNNGGGVIIEQPLPIVIKSYLGIADEKFKYKYQNGAGFANNGFINQLNTLNNDNNVTDVYVMGGWNDEIGRNGITADDIKTAMTVFYSTALEKFPNCKVHLMFISWGGYHTHTWYSGLYAAMLVYRDSPALGFVYHKDAENVMHNKALMIEADSHPNQNGVDKLAQVISCIINGGSPRYSYYFIYTGNDISSEDFTNHSGEAFSVLEEITESGERVLIYKDSTLGWNLTTKSGEPKTLVLNGQLLDLGARPQRLVVGDLSNVQVPATITFVRQNALIATVDGVIKFREDGHLYFSSNFVTDDYTNYNAKTVEYDLILVNAQANFSSPIVF